LKPLKTAFWQPRARDTPLKRGVNRTPLSGSGTEMKCEFMKCVSFIVRARAWFFILGLNLLLVSCRTEPGAPAAASAKAPPARARRIENGVQLETGQLNVKVQFQAENTVRVVKWLPDGSPERSSLVVIRKAVPRLNIRVEESAEIIALASGKLTVQVSKGDGAIRYFSADGQEVLKEARQAMLTPVKIKHEEKAFSVRQDFELTPDEGIYGLGQHQSGYMNYRGRTVTLVQANTEAVTPFLISTAGYGILWDNCSKTVFADDPGKMSLWSEVADTIDYYFIRGQAMDEVIAGYRDLTGTAPMYGKWAYGYWQSKEHYHTRQELLGVAQEYRKRQIPIDNIIQDWNYWGGNSNWSGMLFDETRYPNPKEMVDTLHDMNFHVMISVWPGLGPDTEIFKEMDRKGYLYNQFGWAGFKYYDAYNPQANDIYWNYLKAGLYSKGIDGWWIDSTEPDVVNALTKDSTDYWMKYIGTNHLGSWARYLNAYSLAMTDDLYRNLRRESDRKRVYILTRSTFAGQQRNAATTWSGDIGANWDVYRKQISAGINHSMAGIPYWTFDIGAFVIGSYGGVFSNGGKDPAYQELYTRMFQLGAFSPIFRAHGSETPREIWEFGEFSDVLVKYDRLRYRLLPYIYSLAWQVTHGGYTIMRGLPMDFAADRKTYSIDDQFLFGPAIMVCPVTEYQLHRPPEDSVLIAPEHFRTREGKPGLTARYYNDAEFKSLCREQVEPEINLFWYTGWPDFIAGPKFSIRWEGKLIPSQTGPHRFHMKSFGPKRVFLDGKELACNYFSVEFYTVPVELEAGKEYDFAFETANVVAGAFRAQLFWKTPEIQAREKTVEPREKSRSVYLPAGSLWTDFWTGLTLAGGQTIIADAPIDTIPLLVKAGSILPMGPLVQYAAEKPADPLEVRIYLGADGSFTLYEDENDSYDYEKGVYSTIGFHWDDGKRQLTIDDRQGTFPGMLKERSFQLVLVGKDHGTGVEMEGNPDKVVSYQGGRQVIQF
jgi:alpha-D-xyloside xylohydrolase